MAEHSLDCAADSRGITLTETTTTGGMTLVQENATLAFVLEGRLQQTLDGHGFEAGTGEALYSPRGSRIERSPAEGERRLLTLAFTREPELEFSVPFRNLDVPRHVKAGTFADLPHRLSAELHRNDAVSRLKIEGLLLQIVGDAARLPCMRRNTLPAWLPLAVRVMDEEFVRIGVGEVAAAVRIDPVHMAREFRRHYGFGPGEYLRRLRIDRASKLLSDSSLPLTDVAAESGFCDQSHLTRVFKSVLGLTPSHYRLE
ncbi:MAG TPA: helix-turn-helix domain-containing protein, partial [Thermoanaerobaculia bacterium]|nr:helix-turn-helix domain-containing protein [Thermoanaerobaculia bacterium]